MSQSSVRVSRKGAGRIEAGHVWVFASDVEDAGTASPGDVVSVSGPRSRTLATAHYSSASQITLRLLARGAAQVNRAFYRRRLAAAIEYRQRIVSGSNAYRVAYGEADQLPGLIVDRYGDWLVIQTTSQGMDRAKAEIVSCLKELLSPAGIVERNDVTVREREALSIQRGVLCGQAPAAFTPVEMNGLRFAADLLEGQKTGLYLDQRENYVAAAKYARGRALDCFTSTGGFALHIAGKCESVEAVDSSAAALALASQNAATNSIANVEWREANVFDLLNTFRTAGRRFDTIVLDPPGFAKSRAALENATRAYKEINLRALEMLNPGGVLVTCSCSHHLSEGALLEVVAAAALDAGRTLRVIERRTQAQDHPILLTVPETHYLKCLILEVLTE